ncbi:glycosyltransferase involved in cell wall biosynthesis [Gramella sp. Hel_I_59]|uniref:glycosyltransferase n=1 Tax=Gramella sp. Hel_I_59 TaxID=1249978 RepID=UPI00114FFBB6|nr:glycosyltransferase [Gramella sp. Hel_I_59]TQI71949.1 glycosyltransferase involved in cell wall biosynthesis [Gramella sp. Hel_I_59]
METVSICMITYNHEKYIESAIKSVLAQITSFTIKLYIGEDFSNDGTRRICQTYQRNFPDQVELLPSNKNLGMIPNFVQTLQACDGKYIALLEGDDFWTDPNKLQKQIDFLETNDEYIMCFHDAFKLDEIGTGKTGERTINKDERADISTEDLLIRNRANTLTVVFRNNVLKTYPDWLYTFNGADRFLYLLLSQYGKIKYLPFVGATYRLHSGGISNFKRKPESVDVLINHYKDRIRANETLNRHFNFQYENLISTIIKDYAIQSFLLYFYTRDYGGCKNIISQYKLRIFSSLNYKYQLKFILVSLAGNFKKEKKK